MLSYYAERLSTVEINYTFYRMPNAKTIAGWDAETPDGFTFALKMSRRITHDARLKDVNDSLRYFLDTAGALGPKLGPVLFQLPPYFHKNLERLEGVLALLPAGFRAAFEFRHESWFCEDVYALLRTRNAALCIADTEKGATPSVVTADFGYFRMRDDVYTEEELRKWAEIIVRLGAGWRDIFIYFMHEASGIGPAQAQQLRALLAT
jgi:uncharacterized protein YecE (DUF72 family)